MTDVGARNRRKATVKIQKSIKNIVKIRNPLKFQESTIHGLVSFF